MKRLVDGSSDHRKRMPLMRGLLDYFPDALAAVAQLSWLGSEKHNPGQPMWHNREKSMDHADCIVRHLLSRGTNDNIEVDGVTYFIPHSIACAWRALALAQEELEEMHDLDTPRGAIRP